MSGWLVAEVQCRICGAKHISVYPEDIVDEDGQECHECGHMASEVLEYVS